MLASNETDSPRTSLGMGQPKKCVARAPRPRTVSDRPSAVANKSAGNRVDGFVLDPEGTSDNSPAFQRRGEDNKMITASRTGRLIAQKSISLEWHEFTRAVKDAKSPPLQRLRASLQKRKSASSLIHYCDCIDRNHEASRLNNRRSETAHPSEPNPLVVGSIVPAPRKRGEKRDTHCVPVSRE